jgi:hypothetical protein
MPSKGVKDRGEVGKLSPQASHVARRARIRDIRLFEASAELKDFAVENPLQWDLEINSSTEYNPGDAYFVVTMGYAITIEKPDDPGAEAGDGESGSEDVAEISFQFAALYTLELDNAAREITREEVEDFAATVAASALSPYAREYVHDVTMRMGLPPLVMDVSLSFLPREKA